MSYDQSIKKEYILDKIFEAVESDSHLSSVEKGNNFLEWTLKYLFEKTDSELDENDIEDGVLLVDGAYDGAIDAAFKENSNLKIIQAKYGKSHCIKEVTYFISKMKDLLSGNYNIKNKIEFFDVINNLDEESEVEFFYITNEKFKENELLEIENLTIDFTNFSLQFDFPVRLRIMDINDMCDFIDESLNIIPKKIRGKVNELIVSEFFKSREQTTIIAEVPLKELAKFINKDKDYLYYSNIRNFLGRNRVNKAIEETYNKTPKNFWYYNNGITIVCDHFDEPETFIKGGAKIKITTPQIVNGCQTASTIYKQWLKNVDKKSTQEGTILVKIIKDTNGKRKEITRYTNSQTSVSGKDFYALEDFHKLLKRDFFERGFNYEIQRKEIVKIKPKFNKKYEHLFDKKFAKSSNLYAKDVIQAFTAGMHLKPAKAKNVGNLVPGGGYYDKLFNDQNTPIDSRYYLLPYTVMYHSLNNLNHKEDDVLKTCNLAYISSFFRILISIFENLNLIDVDSDAFLLYSNENISIDMLDCIFTNKNIMDELFRVNDVVFKSFLKDSTIKKKISSNLPRFTKASIETDSEVISILKDQITDQLNDENEIIQRIGILLKANN